MTEPLFHIPSGHLAIGTASPFHTRTLLLLSVIASSAIIFAAITPEAFLLPTLLLGLGYIVWSYNRPPIAVGTIILLYLYLVNKEEGVTLYEVIYGVYFYGYLAVWLFRKILLKRQRIFVTSVDVMLCAFLAVGFLSVLVLIGDHGDPYLWLKEFLTLTGLLVYFPARDAMDGEKSTKIVLGAFLLMVGAIAAYNLEEYRTKSLLATYMWELLGSRRAFGSQYYVAVVVAATSMYIGSRYIRQKIFFLVVLLFFGLALALTFSRGFWLGAILGLLVLFVLMNRREKVRLAQTGILVTVAGIAVLWLFAGNLADYIVRVLGSRLASTGNALEDLSVLERIVESRAVLRLIAENPIMGHGYGASFAHYNIITKVTAVSLFVHSIYLYSLLKVGILGTLVFFWFYVLVIVKGVTLVRRSTQDTFSVSVTRGVVGVLFGFLLIGTNSGLFIEKGALLVLALGAAVVMSRREDPVSINH